MYRNLKKGEKVEPDDLLWIESLSQWTPVPVSMLYKRCHKNWIVKRRVKKFRSQPKTHHLKKRLKKSQRQFNHV